MSYSLHDKPSALPGCCKVCGSADKEWFLDTGTEEEFWGAVYYCNDCISEIARFCGFITPEDAEKIRVRAAELGVENAQLRSELVAMRKIVDGYRDLGSARLLHPSADSALLDSEVVPESAEGAEGGSSEPGEAVGVGAGEAPEPSDVEGVGDIRTDAERPSDFHFSL